MKALDAAEVPLQGVNLVEANAGTGKTYSIASLYLRLVVETGLAVDRILVVSFTEAATAELRTRIRRRLIELRSALDAGHAGDLLARKLISRIDDRDLAIRRLTRALQSFDEAAIFTIHGFCQRLLADTGLEAGALYSAELTTDDSLMRRQIVDDFWRAETSGGSALWLEWLYKSARPSQLADDLQRYFARPAQRRLVPPPVDAAVVDERSFLSRYRSLQQQWAAHRSELLALLNQPAVMNQTSYKESMLTDVFAAADQWATAEPALTALSASKLQKLRADFVAKGTKKGHNSPSHPFFDAFQELHDDAAALMRQFEWRRADLRARLLEHADRELPRRKRARRLRHFDDMLYDVYAMLDGPQSQALRGALRYEAALIDEFQDTDPVQFAIFDALFCQSGRPVFLVGDPKQAIYSFRGADVFAYLHARRQAELRYRLTDNYRSTDGLVDSINQLFDRSPQAFVIDEIDYQPSRAAASIEGLLLDGQPLPSMNWWRPAPQDGRQSADETRTALAAATATEIVRLLTLAADERLTRATVDGPQPLAARDIAVLVRTHTEGDCVRLELSRRGIASAQRTEQSVFKSREAADLACVLRAVARPSNATAVRAALSTELLGYTATQLASLTDDEAAWQELLEAFSEFHQRWRLRGYAPMQRALMRTFGVEARLLALQDGQRRLTNLLHLEDLLQRESVSRHANADDLLLWLQVQRDAPVPAEAALLRLESDENLVRIVTVHYAKGLQFPVVFVPFLLGSTQPSYKNVVEFHDDEGRAALDLGTAELSQHIRCRQREDRAEAVRLAYVALTRAELSCTSAWGKWGRAEKSSLAWLLHHQPGEEHPQLEKRLTGMDAAGWLAPLEQLASDQVTVQELPDPGTERVETDAGTATLVARAASKPPPGWRVSSFSALTRHAVEQPRDYDALDATTAVDPVEPTGIFAFPRGARAGRAMHTLFERIAFDAQPDQIGPVAAAVLSEHGFDSAASGVFATMAHNVLNTALDEDATIFLRDIDARSRISEMEFYFPVDRLDTDALVKALGEFGAGNAIASRLNELEIDLAPGYMRGFIDLVFEANGRFYLLDYKSNWLGAEIGSYREALLTEEIARHDYYLQYLIYTVALHRHLRNVVPDYQYERHFGGVYYLFLRGMEPVHGPSHGVYADRPGAALIERLDRVLAGGNAS